MPLRGIPSHASSHIPTGSDILSNYNLKWSVIGTGTQSWLPNPPARCSFHVAGRYWVFYGDGANLGFRTSQDGITWSAFTAVRATTGYQFSVDWDGSNFHYVVRVGFPSSVLYYRMGRANAGGTITWLAAEQTVLTCDAAHGSGDIDIRVDTNGYPWIAYDYRTVATNNNVAMVTKSKTKNGTWTDENILFAAPYQFSASVFNPDLWCSLTTLTNGKMYVMGMPGIGATGEVNIKGRLWDGAAWQAEETVVTAGADVMASGHISPVAFGDDIHLIYGVYIVATPTIDAYHTKRTYGIGWSAPTAVRLRAATRQTVLSIDDFGTLYCFWLDEPTAGHVYYKKNVSGVWDVNPLDWFMELEAFNPSWSCSVSSKAYNGKIIFVYSTLVASPYNYKVAILSKVLN